MKRFTFPRRQSSDDPRSPEQRYFRIILWAFIVMFLLFTLGGTAAFLLALRGPEQTQVPDMRGDELVDGLIALQERDLHPVVQLRYYADPLLKGRIVSQDPEPGSVVRGGREVTLLVSQGSVVEEVSNFVGRPLADVQADLQALGAGIDRVLFLDAVSYVFDEADPGTVIGQSPEAGTTITGSTGIDLLVSRGPEVERISLPTFLGLDWTDAVQVLSRDNVPFVFQLEEQPTVGRDGVVVGQSPDPGEQVERGTPVTLTIRSPRSLGPDERFGILDRTLPEYAVAVELSAVAVGPEGQSETLFNMIHPGGRLAFPYRLSAGSTIIIYRYDTEVIRYVIREETDSE
jgi:eukaryotic-like serine/threonine-protein kinase